MARVVLVAAAVIVAAAMGVSAGALFGSYDGKQNFPGNGRIAQHNQWLGKKQSVYHYYHSFCTDSSNQNWFFNQVLPSIWNAGSVPAITWTPSVCDKPDRSVPNAVVAGRWDTYIALWAQRLRKFLSGPDGVYGNGDDRRIYISLAHEANGNWESWSGNAAAYRGMWARVRQVFAKNGLSDKLRVQWVFTANNQDVAEPGKAVIPMEQYYPGDNLVDWLAVDGYNWGKAQTWSEWVSPAQVFDSMLARFKRLSPLKPVGIWETSTTSVGGTTAMREQWIKSLFDYVKTQGIKMVLWFNVDKETTWGIWGFSLGNSPAYQAAARDPWFISSDAKNKRLLTDGQFTCRPMAAVAPRFAEADAEAEATAEDAAEQELEAADEAADEAEEDADAEVDAEDEEEVDAEDEVEDEAEDETEDEAEAEAEDDAEAEAEDADA